MTCSDFTEHLLEYDTRTAEERGLIDQHVAGCKSCHAFQNALSDVDVWLDHEFPSIQTSPVFDNRVRSRIQVRDAAVRKPSLVLQTLDLVGYFSLAVALVVTLVLLYPNVTSLLTGLTLKSDAVVGIECIAIMAAIGFAVKVYADLRLDSKT